MSRGAVQAENWAATVPSGRRRDTVIPAMDHCLPGKKVFAGTRREDGRCEKQPLGEIAIAAIAAHTGPPDGSGKIAFINSDAQPYHTVEPKESEL
jgi:hypothetical protein